MGSHQSVFNHVGLCVTDLERARRFYEEALGFQHWWAIAPPDDRIAGLLQLEPPLDLKAVYLVRDGLVLELLGYREGRTEPWTKRSMAEPGLTHISLTVDDLEAAMRAVEECGGEAIRETHRGGGGVMVRDPDGQLIELMPAGWQEKDLPPPRPTA